MVQLNVIGSSRGECSNKGRNSGCLVCVSGVLLMGRETRHPPRVLGIFCILVQVMVYPYVKMCWAHP